MYDQIKHSITRLNEISNTILKELQGDEPRLELIKKEFASREEYIQVLGTYQNSNRNQKLAESDQLGALRPLFDAFLSMNEEIKSKMATLKNQQVEKLARARKQRKVQESYAVSRTPNITHF